MIRIINDITIIIVRSSVILKNITFPFFTFKGVTVVVTLVSGGPTLALSSSCMFLLPFWLEFILVYVVSSLP